MKSRLADSVRYLEKNLGLKMTAYVCGLSNVRPVYFLVRGARPTIEIEMRIRYAYQAVMLVREAYGKDAALAWLMGINSHLRNRAPARVLRMAKTVAELEDVVCAAKAFVSV